MPFGRPLVLDDVKRGEVCALISAGLTMAETARYVGCHPRTIVRAMARDAPFCRAVRQAELTARFDPEVLMRRAATTNWRAAAWLLERTNPRDYGRRTPPRAAAQEIEAACAHVIETAVAEVDDPLRQRKLRATLSAAAREAARGARDPGHGCRRLTSPGRSPDAVTQQFLSARFEAAAAPSPAAAEEVAEDLPEKAAEGVLSAAPVAAPQPPREKSAEIAITPPPQPLPAAPDADKTHPAADDAAPRPARQFPLQPPPAPPAHEPTFVTSAPRRTPPHDDRPPRTRYGAAPWRPQ